MALSVGQNYFRQALQVGVRQVWSDLKNLRGTTLLPVHVAMVSFVLAALMVGNSVELGLRFGLPPSWRLVYLPINILAMFAIFLVTIFVRNKGSRLAQGDPVEFLDRADS